MKNAATALIVVASLTVAVAQTTKSTARIRGRVVAAATGRAVRNATVWVGALGNTDIRKTVRTDANGQYELADLPAGRYSFTASHPAYLTQNFDQPRPLARYRLLELAEGEQLDGIDFSLHRGGVITGIISDESGDPLPDVRVTAVRELHGPFGRTLFPAQTPMVIPTDDQGRYRVFGLIPGTYLITATAAQTEDSALGYGRTFFPGTMNEAEAQILRVDLGSDTVADFSMIPARLAHVAGVVRDSRGSPVSSGRITMTTSLGANDMVGMASLDNRGAFSFDRVLPGRYLLHVRPRGGEPRLVPANGEWATMPVIVTGDDISNLVVTTSSGFVVSGHVRFEGSVAPPSATGLRFVTGEIDQSLQRMAYSSMARNNGVADAAGRFRIVGVSGKVRVTTGGPLPTGWFFKRALLNGTDVTNSGFEVDRDVDGIEVVLTDRATTVTGTVRNAQRTVVNDYIVAFFPVGQFQQLERAQRQRTIRPDPDGIYRIRNLPPGDYLAAAVPVLSLPIGGEWDPAFAERVRPRAIGFKLAEGQSLALTHQLIE